MKEISYIDPLRSALIVSIVVTITGMANLLFAMFTSGAGVGFQAFGPLTMVLYVGATSFFSSLLGCFVYNLVAMKFGGIRIQLN